MENPVDKILAAFDLLRRGSAVADPEVLHDRAKLVVVLTGLLTAIGNAAPKLFGVDLPLDPETCNLLAGGIAAAWLLVSGWIASPERGILPARKPEPVAAPAPVSEPEPSVADRYQPVPVPPFREADREAP